ncbi:type IV leader peptidase family protein [mine drainage metagenome]|uniref:Type IV leader peptidase family protein n=1 Tax=mine drainage metagenome TaxID=410659 RepID=A0A1J5TMN7_9ZZZZ
MTPNLMGLLALAPLLVLLVLIALQDIRSHRIPNKMVLIGLILGLCLNGLLPKGLGFNSVAPGALGWLDALQGIGLGLLIFLPLYWLRVMAAGDVKLMAMVGAFLGSDDVLGALLATFIAGGVMGLVIVVRSRQVAQLLQNMKFMLLGGMVNMNAGQLPIMSDLPMSVGKLPYAVAIAMGTLCYLVWQRIQYMQ